MKRLLYGTIFLLICAVSNATHNRAGQILYRHISGYTYEFTIYTFTYSLSAADRPSLEISWGDNFMSILQRSNGPVNNRGEHFGELLEPFSDNYKKNEYKGQHTFPGPGIYTIVVADPNRNLGIENIPNSVGVQFGLKTIFRINPNTGHNSAPELLIYPTDKAAVGKLFIHNPGAEDWDDDELSYELAVCLRERGIEIENYTLPEASNELYVDPVWGDFVWDAPVKDGIYNVAMKINEWRNGVQIGSIIRDMQIEVVDHTDNNPPKFPDDIKGKDTCVIAGETISFYVEAKDEDEDYIKLTATGLPFLMNDSKATFKTVDSVAGYIRKLFTWETKPAHVRNQPYTIRFKAEDHENKDKEDKNEDNNFVRLVSIANYNITVIADSVKNLTAIAKKEGKEKVIDVEWNRTPCHHALGYEIYRRIGADSLRLDPCETGIPSRFGYERIDTVMGVRTTVYRDNNKGMGLSPGMKYYYRVVAFFNHDLDYGPRSLPSDTAHATLPAGTPPIIRAHVEKIDEDVGEIHVEWLEKPVKDIIEQFEDKTGPFEYRLFYSTDRNNWSQLYTSDFEDNDTVFHHKQIDTKTKDQHYYKVEFWEKNGKIVDDDFEEASTLRPKLTPSDKSVIINFERYTPWVNSRYYIYRCSKTGADICFPVDTVTNYRYVGYTDGETFVDKGLENGQEYCYLIRSVGYRVIDGILYKNENMSHIACETPVDNVPPCAPTLEVESICEESRNQLRWSYKLPYDVSDPNCPGGWDDVEKYNIYFTRDPMVHTKDYNMIHSVMSRDIFEYSHDKLIGCYYVTAVDAAGNESDASNIVCLDECGGAGTDGGYELPNVFTPNDDNINDFFKAYIPDCDCSCEDCKCKSISDIVTKVDMKIYNRVGKLVFKTDEPCINWDGRDMDSKRFVSTGVYFYTCEVYENRLEGERIIPLSGIIHVYRERANSSPVSD